MELKTNGELKSLLQDSDAMREEREEIDKVVKLFKSKLLKVCFVRQFFYFSCIALFLYGIILLSLRFIGIAIGSEIVVASSFFILFCTIVTALYFTFGKIPSLDILSAYLEKYNACGGLLICSYEGMSDAWLNDMPKIELPGIRLNYKSWIVPLFASLIFFILCIILPIGNFDFTDTSGHLNISGETTELDEQINILNEENVFNDTEAEELRKSLIELKENAEASDPARIWESLDNIAAVNSCKAEEFSEKALSEIEESAMFEKLASSLKEKGFMEKMGEEGYKDALKATESLLRKSKLIRNKLNTSEMNRLLKSLKKGSLTNGELDGMRKMLEKFRKMKIGSIKRLCSGKMLRPSVLKKCRSCSKCSKGKLAEYLKKCNSKRCNFLAQSLCACNLPCNGSVSRGRGDASMTYKARASNANGMTFQDHFLPEGFINGREESMLLEESFAAPSSKDGEISISGSLKNVKSGQSASYRHAVLPKHKKIIRQYFNTEQ